MLKKLRCSCKFVWSLIRKDLGSRLCSYLGKRSTPSLLQRGRSFAIPKVTEMRPQ